MSLGLTQFLAKCTAVVAVVSALAWASNAQAESKIALVIGNSAYWDLPLKNPANDARLMSETLRGLGFDVMEFVDLDQQGMKQAILDFGERLENDWQETVGLFFYAGHGVQVNGTNYLIPVDAKIRREADVEVVAVNANWVLGQMEFAGNPLNIVVLDACRNNPYHRSFRNSQVGLARMSAPSGTMIAYATRPGDVSSDGVGENSPYTTALARTIQEPGLSLSDVFIDVRNSVMSETDGKQVPWEEGGLTGRFYFKPAPQSSIAEAPPTPSAPATDIQPTPSPDVVFWQSVVDSGNPSAFEAYLAQFPEGIYAGLARMKIDELNTPPEPETTEVAMVAPMPEPARPAFPGGRVFQDCADCPEMIVIPYGLFRMGSQPGTPDTFENEYPVHEVAIDRAFAVGRTEVTVGQFAAFVAATGHQTGIGCHRREGEAWSLDNGADWARPGYKTTNAHPVACVSWDDAMAYTEWLTQQTGYSYRLLSEAEWEYVARAGTGSTRYWQDDQDQCFYANGADQTVQAKNQKWTAAPCSDGYSHTAPVSTFQGNAFGVYDIFGNVSEWLADCWNDSYFGAPNDGSPWLSGDCGQRVRRGGSWTQTGTPLRAADRHREGTGFRDYDNGFRVARTLP